MSFVICFSIHGDIVGEVEKGYVFRFGELETVDVRVDDDGVDAGSREARLSFGGIGSGNHKEGALFSCFCFVGVALEQSAGKRIGIILHEEKFHPGVGDDVIVIFQYPFVGTGVFGKPGRDGIGLYGATYIVGCGDGSGIVEEAADNYGDEKYAE